MQPQDEAVACGADGFQFPHENAPFELYSFRNSKLPKVTAHEVL
jgi:hypothetical protein